MEAGRISSGPLFGSRDLTSVNAIAVIRRQKPRCSGIGTDAAGSQQHQRREALDYGHHRLRKLALRLLSIFGVFLLACFALLAILHLLSAVQNAGPGHSISVDEGKRYRHGSAQGTR